MSAAQHIEKLRNEIRRHDRLYYVDAKPEISSHHLKVVGGAYGKRKGFIYEPISTQNKKRQEFLPVFFVL